MATFDRKETFLVTLSVQYHIGIFLILPHVLDSSTIDTAAISQSTTTWARVATTCFHPWLSKLLDDITTARASTVTSRWQPFAGNASSMQARVHLPQAMQARRTSSTPQ